MRTTLLIFVGVLTLGGCASVEVSETNYASADEALADARAAGAEEYAGAALTEAENKLEMAKNAIDDNDEEAAQRYVAEAKVSAELAQATAQSEKSQLAANQVRESMRALQNEMSR